MDEQEIEESKRVLYPAIIRSVGKNAVYAVCAYIVAGIVLIMGAHLAFAAMERHEEKEGIHLTFFAVKKQEEKEEIDHE